MPKEKVRLDELLVQKKLCENIKRAQSLILSGSVLVNNQKITKSGLQVKVNSQIVIIDKIPEYVSRGAFKLKHAIERFKVKVKDKIAIDLGSSTGGFTQILLEQGVGKVYAFDVGYGQMVSRLRNDYRVKVRDRFNVRNLSWNELDTFYQNLLIVMDLSFISLFSIFPTIRRLKEDSHTTRIEVISLIKPQFECSKSELVKGIVVDEEVHFKIIKKFIRYIKNELKGKVLGLSTSPISGRDGNREFLLYWELD